MLGKSKEKNCMIILWLTALVQSGCKNVADCFVINHTLAFCNKKI